MCGGLEEGWLPTWVWIWDLSLALKSLAKTSTALPVAVSVTPLQVQTLSNACAHVFVLHEGENPQKNKEGL